MKALLQQKAAAKPIGKHKVTPAEEVNKLRKLYLDLTTVSLEKPFFKYRGSCLSLQEILPAFENFTDKVEIESDINIGLKTVLTGKEVGVISLRFGLKDGRPHTQEETGKKFRLTKERVRQIEDQAINKLRNSPIFKQLAAAYLA